MIDDLEKDLNNQVNEVWKSFQDLDEKLSDMDEKSSKETEILSKKEKGNVGN
jgi:hypothetical protein